jgi:hypothetical protein
VVFIDPTCCFNRFWVGHLNTLCIFTDTVIELDKNSEIEIGREVFAKEKRLLSSTPP